MRYDEGQNERYKKAVRRGSVALELTTCINKLADGRYGIGEALNKISNIIKLCMKRAFGNKQVDTAKTSWWNAECETAKLKFRQAHRRDTVNINAVGALRLSAETVELRKIIKNKARRCHDMKNAELLTSDFFMTRDYFGGTSRVNLTFVPSVTLIGGPPTSKAWSEHRMPTLLTVSRMIYVS